MSLDKAYWTEVAAIFDAVVDLDGAERATILSTYPLLAVFNVPGSVFAVPVLYASFFAAWAALIALMALVIERRG